jgi:hypothetical protein
LCKKGKKEVEGCSLKPDLVDSSWLEAIDRSPPQVNSFAGGGSGRLGLVQKQKQKRQEMGGKPPLIDVTVARPNTLTLMRGSATDGAHMQPLVATAHAEKRKHARYDAECARHGWKMVPFAMESLGAKGAEATKLLLRMASHSLDKSPAAFLEHADRRLSAALQIGNAHVAVQGSTDLLLHSYRSSLFHSSASSGAHIGDRRSIGARSSRQRLRSASARRSEAGMSCGDYFGAIVHGDYRSARVGVRGSGSLSLAAAVAC